MNKQNPGPWVYSAVAEQILDSEGNVIVWETGTNEANNYLIAAAPELLDALIRLFANGSGIHYANWTKAQHDANAAIQKATGEKDG